MATSTVHEVTSAIGEVVDGPVLVGAVYPIVRLGDVRELGAVGVMATMSAVAEIVEMAD